MTSTTRRRYFSVIVFGWILTLLLGSCGGGVGTGGTGSDKPAVSQGPITGFGSIIVAGVTWDDSNATVVNEDGAPLMRDGNELRLGMTVEIEGTDGDAPQARTIRVDSTIVGPVTSVDASNRTLTVLGQNVRVEAGTVFDEGLPLGLAGLRPGHIVTVYALPDAAGAGQLATRVEPASAQAVLRLRGVVSGLDTTSRTLRIGNLTLSFADLANVPGGLANGIMTRVTVRSLPSGQWSVAGFGPPVEPPREGVHVEVDGLVSGFEGLHRFSVGGLPVDARAATVRPMGAVLANGLRVEVRGEMSGGVLLAERVSVRGNRTGGGDGSGNGAGNGSGNGGGNGNGNGGGGGSDNGNGSGNGDGSGNGNGNGNGSNGNGNGNGNDEDRVYTVNGRISRVDATQGIFVIRKMLVDHRAAAFLGGASVDLAAGKVVRVEGRLSTDGTRLHATRVEFR
jgi:hypothetical protein